MIERLIDRAVALLTRGEPVPTDLIFRLVEAGVDFSELEAAHS
jgi:hypothetical protein